MILIMDIGGWQKQHSLLSKGCLENMYPQESFQTW